MEGCPRATENDRLSRLYHILPSPAIAARATREMNCFRTGMLLG